MQSLVIETVDRSDADYRIEATDSETTVSVFCSTEQIVVVRDCIETTLSEDYTTSCGLGKLQGFALSPHPKYESGTHKLIIATEDTSVSIPVEEQRLKKLLESNVESLPGRRK